MNHTTSPLTVYRASAGAGKTFTLAVEYISLLVKDTNNYKQILAVTFTNKATQEMKMRILSQLYGIAKGLKSSEPYLQQVKNKTGLDECVIKNNANKALTLLIHKYNEFRIHTIDAFFQQILRNLAHELGLTANLRVDLNDKEVEEKAVDQMIENLQPEQPVMKWINSYIDNNMEEDKGWNVITNIKAFGTNIFKDYYKAHEKQLADLLGDEKKFDSFEKSLRLRRKKIKETYNNKAKAIVSVIDNADLNDTLTRYLYPYLVKQTSEPLLLEEDKKYILNAINDPKKWFSSANQKKSNYIEIVTSNALPEKLSDLVKYNKDNFSEFQSIKLMLNHLPELRLLHKISEAVNELNKETNRFMLSNTQSLLKELIADSDTPFIFEKIGAQLKHIMIDEFQDTSTIQWQNFLSLLNNCMGQIDSHNLIVGDIKQSIYRWRQGDWSILNNIKDEFPNYDIDLQTLDYNYRSAKRIVRFNNVFMKAMVDDTIEELNNDKISKSEIIRNAYKDIEQKTHKKEETGCVRIKLFPSNDSDTEILNRLTETIQDLFSKGYNGKNQSKTAILIRESKHLQQIVDTLYAADFGEEIKIVSDEAFRLESSLAVNVIIKALHLLTHPEDILTRGELVKLYNQQVLKKEVSDTELLVAPSVDKENVEAKEWHKLSIEQQTAKLNESLPKRYTEQREQLLGMPVIDVVDTIFELFELSKLKGQNSYICTLYDILNDFLQDNTADIDDFIQEWENSLSSKTIQSDEIEGIRIITIHKSKGLEFENVIIPFCEWKLEVSPSTIWCETKNKPEPYNKIPIIPISYGKKPMLGTVFEDDYKEEHLQNTIDNLNLLYVAVTRAAKNLFITGKRKSKKNTTFTSTNRSERIENVLEKVASELEDSTLDFPENVDEPISFEYGILDAATNEREAKELENPFLVAPEKHVVNITTYPQKVNFRQSNKSREFVNAEDTDHTDTARYIKNGNILHQIFSTIYTHKDIPSKLLELEQEGFIYNDEITTAELHDKINTALKNKTVQSWFSEKWTLFNECTILQYNKELDEVRTYRPDRVMTDGNETIVVDFKTGIVRKEHKLQVEKYMKLLQQMGHRNISGYLWYILQDKIIEVTI